MKLIFLVGLAAGLFSIHILWGPAGLDPYVIENVRLPRALGAVVVGVALAVAGLLLQTMYRNPLADPYVLGVSGAALLASLAFFVAWRLFGVQYVGYFAGSTVGAAAAILALLWVSRRAPLTVVVLTGVFIAFAASAAVDMLLLYIPPEELGYVYSALGGTFAAYPAGPLGYVVALAVAAFVAAVYMYARWVSAYIHGEEAAAGLGVNTRLVNTLGVSAAAVLTGVAVAAAGPVGFLGLAAPHIGRWVAKSVRLDKSFFYVAAVGAVLALVADLAVRLFLPRDISVTAVLSLVGVPVAVYYMWRYVRGV